MAYIKKADRVKEPVIVEAVPITLVPEVNADGFNV